jgi:hypothetical protein
MLVSPRAEMAFPPSFLTQDKSPINAWCSLVPKMEQGVHARQTEVLDVQTENSPETRDEGYFNSRRACMPTYRLAPAMQAAGTNQMRLCLFFMKYVRYETPKSAGIPMP